MGYGYVRIEGELRPAHRVAYELLIGLIPDGLFIDHVREQGCAHRNCVNPAHLEPVTNAVNILRGDSLPAQNARLTRCKYGHEYTPENTYIYRGTWRRCRACNREAQRRRYARR